MAYQSIYNGATIDEILSKANALYPIGSIYLSVDSTSPAAIWGGIWEQITDKFLLGAGPNYVVGQTGGASNHTHTSAAHTHSIAGHTHTTQGHILTEAELPVIDGSFGLSVLSGHAEYATGHFYGTSINTPHMISGASDTGSTPLWAYGYKFGGGASHNHGNTGATSLTTTSTTPASTGGHHLYLLIQLFIFGKDWSDLNGLSINFQWD